MTVDRRTLLGASTLAAAALAPGLHKAAAQTPLAPPPPVTQILARYLVNARFEDLPATVRKEGTRTFFNWVGVTVGGSHHETVDHAVAAMSPFAGKPEANLLGRARKARQSQRRADQRHRLPHFRL